MMHDDIEDMFAELERELSARPWYTTARHRASRIKRLPRWVRWKLKQPRHFVQRGRRGYAGPDAWGGDRYLAQVIAGVVRGVRDDEWVGCPHELYVGYGEDRETSHLAYRIVLNSIVEGFELYSKMDDLLFDKMAMQDARQRYEWAKELFNTYHETLWT